MNISDLIAKLQTTLTEHGDLPVYHVDDDAEGAIDVQVSEPENALGYDSQFHDLPKRITISST